MARPDENPSTPTRARRRWVWPAALTVLLLAGLGVGGVWWWNASAARGLDAAVAELRRAGEPVTIADLAATPVPADRNAAPDLRAAAGLIDTKSDD